MKKRRRMILGAVVLLMAVAVAAAVTQVPKWSQKSFEAVVESVVTQPDKEVRLIVQRTTEIYDNPRNSLCISEDTALVGADGKAVSIADFHQGDAVRVTLKDAFLEEIPFYYPTVYEIKMMAEKQ